MDFLKEHRYALVAGVSLELLLGLSSGLSGIKAATEFILIFILAQSVLSFLFLDR